MRYKLLLVLVVLLGVLPAAAQESAAQRVEVTAGDGLVLVGDWYAPADAPAEGAPAILLIHMLNSTRQAYEPLIPILHDAGYAVLNVDMRGHGDSKGTRDWVAAETDVQLWFDFIREQDGVSANHVAVIGASIGSNLAIIGCANDAACVTAIALSPGKDYHGVRPMEALTDGLRQRSVMLVSSHNDAESANGVRDMVSEARRTTMLVRLYNGNAHGTSLFRQHLPDLSYLILGWLDEQFAAVEVE